MDSRPQLNTEISIKDFQEFYWLKQELVAFCRLVGLKSSGGKIEIADRIVHYLKTGEKVKPNETSTQRSTSNFNWNTEILTVETLITDNYNNTENVRNFYTKQIGKQFKFNVNS